MQANDSCSNRFQSRQTSNRESNNVTPTSCGVVSALPPSGFNFEPLKCAPPLRISSLCRACHQSSSLLHSICLCVQKLKRERVGTTCLRFSSYDSARSSARRLTHLCLPSCPTTRDFHVRDTSRICRSVHLSTRFQQHIFHLPINTNTLQLIPCGSSQYRHLP
jgi:hypothetical protein